MFTAEPATGPAGTKFFQWSAVYHKTKKYLNNTDTIFATDFYNMTEHTIKMQLK